jgi:hypothetical protein
MLFELFSVLFGHQSSREEVWATNISIVHLLRCDSQLSTLPKFLPWTLPVGKGRDPCYTVVAILWHWYSVVLLTDSVLCGCVDLCNLFCWTFSGSMWSWLEDDTNSVCRNWLGMSGLLIFSHNNAGRWRGDYEPNQQRHQMPRNLCTLLLNLCLVITVILTRTFCRKKNTTYYRRFVRREAHCFVPR